MKLFTVLSLAATVSLSKAITLPELPNGSYIFSLNKDGETVWENVTDLVTPSTAMQRRTEFSSLHPRQDMVWPSDALAKCQWQEWMGEYDFYQHSWNQFYDLCTSKGAYYYPASTVLASYWGQSVSYMCAFTSNPCTAKEWVHAVNIMANTCRGRYEGWMEAAQFSIPSWHKRYGYGKPTYQVCPERG